MITDILTSVQAKELFEKEAILIGTSDGVPIFRAVELFGERAAEYARTARNGASNSFGIGHTTLWFLTLTGFVAAAGWANTEKICPARPDHDEDIFSDDEEGEE